VGSVLWERRGAPGTPASALDSQAGRTAGAQPFAMRRPHDPPPPPPPTTQPTRLHSKKKAVHKAAGTDDKRLQSTLKRLGVHAIGGIEEVALFSGDGATVFTSPRVQASIGSNTFVVSGPSQERSMEEMLPAMLGNLPPEALAALAAQVQSATGRGGPGAGAGAGGEEDEDVPELVEEIEDEKE